ncbi:DUF530 domain-containing protein [Methanobacterium formicicum]|uniref:DUF530 domain-containing protein n=1 Tax=Methanobacterium formicicum (strain DSM 3637 / PP1) TaxID=1204725 RepID=K2R9D8_METFP|nr:DUF530 domain-containing protein [Methanobacterium formicicum]EKF84929.1 hypothetical protein A994_11047 [Methanobacterium formicicum DSM 3637]
MNESVLIGKSERFLDQIKRREISLSGIESPEKFLTLYTYLKKNMDTLQDMRETMEIKGYTAPYRSINKYGRPLSGEAKAEDMYDISRHTQYFRLNAAAKKNILDRVKSAMSSHRIAIGHLEEFATMECESCHHKYSGHELSLLTGGNCQCGGDNLSLHVNKEAVYRLEIIPFLPLSGDYMVKLSELSPHSRVAFRSMVRILKQEKRGIVKTVSLVIKIMEDGRWVRKRVTIDAQDEANYEKEIRSQYGSNARIEMMQFHRKKPSIINDKQMQTALSLGYVKYAETEILNFLPDLLEKSLSNMEKVKEYREALEVAERNANKYENGDEPESLKKFFLKKELEERGLLDDGVLPETIQEDLKKKESIEKSLFLEIPRIYILWDLLHYYLTTSYDRRNKYSGPFPYLRPSLDSNQIKAFKDFKQDVVQIMQDHLPLKIEYVHNMGKVLSSKFAVEKKMKGLHLQMGPALGAAILSIEGDIPTKKTSELFSISLKDVQKEKETLETLQKPATSKAKQFMAMMKK